MVALNAQYLLYLCTPSAPVIYRAPGTPSTPCTSGSTSLPLIIMLTWTYHCPCADAEINPCRYPHVPQEALYGARDLLGVHQVL